MPELQEQIDAARNSASFKSLKDIMDRQEELCPELAQWMEESDHFSWIKHPLIVTIYHPAMNAMYNEQFRVKSEWLAKKEAEGEYESALWFHERAYRFYMFRRKYAKLMGNKKAAVELPELWRDAEFPYAARQEWLDIWRTYAPLNPKLAKSLKHLPKKPFEIYRGMSTAEFEGEYPVGMSWTIDVERAKWFAQRFQKDGGKVGKALVHPNVVFAYLPERGESEVVVDADEIWEIYE